MTNNLNTKLIHVGDISYPYHYGINCVPAILESMKHLDADRFIVVTDGTVLNLHGSQFLPGLSSLAPVTLLSVPPGDAAKSILSLSEHLEQAITDGATRRSVVIGFGGGAPGNLAGLVAALLFSGVRLVHVPTTTLAAMDSVISLQQAINSSRGMNTFGTFLTPNAVYLDVQMLQSLPDRELRSGLGEATKNCLAVRPGSIDRLRALASSGRLDEPESMLWLLEESLAVKTAVTFDDPHEQGRGLVLEYGHTVGHALELCDRRRRGAEGFSHGASVMFGMIAAARISVEMGLMRPETLAVHTELAQVLGAPQTIPPGIEIERMMTAIRADNKRGYLPLKADEAALVILHDLGRPAGTSEMPLIPVPLNLIRHVLEEMSLAHAAVHQG
ncbi:iron-containing alcohol dehydrogenase [Kineosporia sp. NBRC 101731]|uniref:3-dehydroquinate synthase family protein n=1 Tax=Kineosporia sp. NBRC 101731 TaxID=3032199 RepID=UPI0024A3C6A3|nr:iron-containing alcohol dehydrogenase [Kineosporia sp. NBRC 101731]GLY29062.1 3-dehydroquinate synthase [Kineosporia sp. NBRC 101731]